MKNIIGLTAAALLAAVLPAAAGIRIGLIGGYTLTPDVNQGQGLAVGALVAFDLSPNFALELGALRYQTPVTASAAGLSAGSLAVLPIEISLKVHFPVISGVELFAGAGGGVYLPQFSPDAAAAASWAAVGFVPAEKLNTAYGFHVKGGLEVALGRGVGLVFQARYAAAQADGTWSLTDSRGGPSVNGKITGFSLDSIILGLGLNIAL